ncbi:MAG: MATE family efflux transporter [Rhizobiaceae bacterium]|nr:MATE family efflux transporter [Rhizobiaceae bacterium]
MTEVAERTGVALGPGWKSHVVETLALGLPLIGAQLAQNGIHVTDIVIIGRLGTNELAAMVLAAQFYFTIFIFGSGFTAAVVPLAAQAFSQGDVQHVRRAVRMGLWVVFAFSALAMPLIYYAEPVLVAMGQDRHVSALAAGYLHIAGWGMFPALAFMVLRSFLSAVGKAGFVLYVTLVVLVVNAVFAYGLVLGHLGMPALGMTGAAIVALSVNILSFVLTIWYVQAVPELRRFEIFVRFWRADRHMLAEVFSLGLPIGLTILAEVSLFTVASLLMGWIGTAELAAHGIALQCSSLAFMIPLGLAQAATVRIGIAAGANDREGMIRAAWVVVAISAGVALIGGLLFAAFPSFFAGLFLDNSKEDAAAVLGFATTFVMVAGAFQMVDGLQAIGAGLLRGIKDTRIPMILALISYWAVGFVLAYMLAFPLGFGGIGIWLGFVFGLLAASILLLGRFAILVRRMPANP